MGAVTPRKLVLAAAVLVLAPCTAVHSRPARSTADDASVSDSCPAPRPWLSVRASARRSGKGRRAGGIATYIGRLTETVLFSQLITYPRA